MKYKFENGLGVSVIDDGGYGRGGLFELALLKDDEVAYNRDLGFSDVKGWLTADEAAKVLTEVSKYDPKGKEFTDTPLSYFED